MLLGIEAPGLSFSEMDLWRVFLERLFWGPKGVDDFGENLIPSNNHRIFSGSNVKGGK